jgi:hypothetical protein
VFSGWEAESREKVALGLEGKVHLLPYCLRHKNAGLSFVIPFRAQNRIERKKKVKAGDAAFCLWYQPPISFFDILASPRLGRRGNWANLMRMSPEKRKSRPNLFRSQELRMRWSNAPFWHISAVYMARESASQSRRPLFVTVDAVWPKEAQSNRPMAMPNGDGWPMSCRCQSQCAAHSCLRMCLEC